MKGARETGEQYLVNNYQDVEMKKKWKICELTCSIFFFKFQTNIFYMSSTPGLDIYA